MEKLRYGWIGLYIVVNVFPDGAIEIKDPTKDNVFNVNGYRLKNL